MRSQTLMSRSDGHVRFAGPVDATGWLAPAPTDAADSGTPGTTEAGRRARRRAVRRTGGHAGRGLAGRRRQALSTRALIRIGTTKTAARKVTTDTVGVADHPCSEGGYAAERYPDRGRSDSGYRMSRWARLALTVTVLAAAVVVVVALTSGPSTPRWVDVTVAPGDSLWSIASTSAPDRDPRAVIEEIKQLNDVPGDLLPIGAVLRVPASAG